MQLHIFSVPYVMLIKFALSWACRGRQNYLKPNGVTRYRYCFNHVLRAVTVNSDNVSTEPRAITKKL
jgi:hypothetical protein